MTSCSTLDNLARALGKARERHERRPDDARAYVAFLEAHTAWLKAWAAAEIAAREAETRRERGRAAELGRRLKRLQAARLDAVIDAGRTAKTSRRRARGDVAGVPLLEHCEALA